MSDVLTNFKVTEKALLVQAVTFNEWSLTMIDYLIAEKEASLIGVKEAVVEDGLERILNYLEKGQDETTTPLTDGGNNDGAPANEQ